MWMPKTLHKLSVEQTSTVHDIFNPIYGLINKVALDKCNIILDI